MSTRIVSQPDRGHRCGVTDYGVWSEAKPLPPDHPAFNPELPGQCYIAFIHEYDAPGTVRACDECGKTWVAFRGNDGTVVTRWRPEGRLARWLRERSHRDRS